MKKYYTIKVWPRTIEEERLEINKYQTMREAQNAAQNDYNVIELMKGRQWSVVVRFGNPKSLAENYLNMREAMRG